MEQTQKSRQSVRERRVEVARKRDEFKEAIETLRRDAHIAAMERATAENDKRRIAAEARSAAIQADIVRIEAKTQDEIRRRKAAVERARLQREGKLPPRNPED